jgi:GSH-dependent disulfide-bond oxidoreductase
MLWEQPNTMIDLYTSSTGNGRRAAIALAECGLQHRVHRLDLAKGEQHAPAFLAINPAAAIPAIHDPSGPAGVPVSIAQSGAIVLYCAEKSGRLMPKDPTRRIVAWQWFMQALSDVQPTSSAIFYSGQPEGKSAAVTAYFEQRLMAMFAGIDQQLLGRDYLADEFSIADVALYPVVLGRHAMIEAAQGLADLKAWSTRVANRHAVAQAVAANG